MTHFITSSPEQFFRLPLIAKRCAGDEVAHFTFLRKTLRSIFWYSLVYSKYCRLLECTDEINDTAQLTFTCSKATIETLEKRCEICSKLKIKIPERRHRWLWASTQVTLTCSNLTIKILEKGVKCVQNEQ